MVNLRRGYAIFRDNDVESLRYELSDLEDNYNILIECCLLEGEGPALVRIKRKIGRE
jgi:hypothetical protein